MAAIKVRAIQEGYWDGKVVPVGKEFILVDKSLPAIKASFNVAPRKAQVYTAEQQFAEEWMERVEGASPAELVRAQRIEELKALTETTGQEALPGQAKQGGMMVEPAPTAPAAPAQPTVSPLDVAVDRSAPSPAPAAAPLVAVPQMGNNPLAERLGVAAPVSPLAGAGPKPL